CLLRRATAVSLPESEADGEAPPRADGRVAAPRQPWVLQVDGGEAVEHRGEGDGPFQPGERRAPAELGPRPKAKWRTSARSTSNRSGSGNAAGSRLALPMTAVTTAPPGTSVPAMSVGSLVRWRARWIVDS